MSLSREKILIAVALVATVATGFVVVQNRKGRLEAEARLQYNALRLSNSSLTERLERIRASLEVETPAESLKKLTQIDSYYWPGPSGLPSIIFSQLPLAADKGGIDLGAILSNRRVRKVFVELREETKEAATAKVIGELNGAVDDYLSRYESMVSKDISKLQQSAFNPSDLTPSFFISTSDPDEITMEGLRLKILTMVWFSGILELVECHEVVGRIARIAVKQRDEMYQNTILSDFYKMEMLEKGSLYNRQILATALLGVTMERALRNKATKNASVKWEEPRVVSYSALLTEYDLPVAARVMNVDKSRGVIKMKVVAPLTDEQFDTIWQDLEIAH